ALAQSWRHGLNPKMYWTDRMEEEWQRRDSTLKREANQKYLSYLQALYTGALRPDSLTRDIKVKKKTFVTPEQLQPLITANGNRASLVAEGLAPKTSQYLALKSALNKVYNACTSGTWGDLPTTSTTLKLGVRDKTVPFLKARLALLGYSVGLQDDLVDER